MLKNLRKIPPIFCSSWVGLTLRRHLASGTVAVRPPSVFQHSFQIKKGGGEKGFSIVEMLVVIAIIGFIGSLIFVQLQSSRQRARDAEREQEIKSLQNALAIYATNAGKYPPSNTALLPYAATALTGSDPISADLRNSDALTQIPLDPLNSGNFVYKYQSTDGSTYTLTYYLETDTILGKPSANNPQSATP